MRFIIALALAAFAIAAPTKNSWEPLFDSDDYEEEVDVVEIPVGYAGVPTVIIEQEEDHRRPGLLGGLVEGIANTVGSLGDAVSGIL